MPAAAPITKPASHWYWIARRLRRRLNAQTAISQASVAGSMPAVSSENRSSQSSGSMVSNMTPTPATACTNSTARSTTPTWQASNSKAPDAAGIKAAASSPGGRLPCSVESSKVGRVTVGFIGMNHRQWSL